MCLSSFLQKYGFIMKKTLYSLFFVVLVLSFCLWIFVIFWLKSETKTEKSDPILDSSLEPQEKTKIEQGDLYETMLFSGPKDALLQNWGTVKEEKWKIVLNNVFWKEIITLHSRKDFLGLSFSQSQNQNTLRLYDTLYDDPLISEGLEIWYFDRNVQKWRSGSLGLVKQRWEETMTYLPWDHNQYQFENLTSNSPLCHGQKRCSDLLYSEEMNYEGLHNGYQLSRVIDFWGYGYWFALRTTNSQAEAKKQIFSITISKK